LTATTEGDFIGWNNLLDIEKGDHLSFENHPVLANLGDEDLLFRVIGKSYLLGDENPARIQLVAIEV
jgi:hypothetical protein